MLRLRFTLRTLVALVAALAVGLAAFKLIPPWWQYWQSIRTLTG